jgi:hypothetical protein
MSFNNKPLSRVYLPVFPFQLTRTTQPWGNASHDVAQQKRKNKAGGPHARVQVRSGHLRVRDKRVQPGVLEAANDEHPEGRHERVHTSAGRDTRRYHFCGVICRGQFYCHCDTLCCEASPRECPEAAFIRHGLSNSPWDELITMGRALGPALGKGGHLPSGHRQRDNQPCRNKSPRERHQGSMGIGRTPSTASV